MKKTLKELRKLKNLTQIDLAYKLGITQSTYVFLEQGKTKLSIDKIEKLAEIFNIPVDELYYLQETKKNVLENIQENDNRVEELERRIRELEKENEQSKNEVSDLKGKLNDILYKNVELSETIDILEKEKQKIIEIIELWAINDNNDWLFLSQDFECCFYDYACKEKENYNIKNLYDFVFYKCTDYKIHRLLKDFELFDYDEDILNQILSIINDKVKGEKRYQNEFWHNIELSKLLKKNDDEIHFFLKERIIKYLKMLSSSSGKTLDDENEWLLHNEFLYNWWFIFLKEEIEDTKKRLQR